MDKIDLNELADWLKHMVELWQASPHPPEARNHVDKLKRWERGVRTLAENELEDYE